MAQEYVVIGLGQLGKSVALNLARLGQSVLAIDHREASIQEIAADVDAAVVADSTDERTLRELGVGGISCAVVAIGADAVEASIMTCALLKQLGVPRIIARAVGELHARVLRGVGANEVINSEEEMGRRLALRLAQPTIQDQIDLGDATLVEMRTPAQFVGKSLKDLDVRNRHKVSVVGVKRGNEVLANPGAAEVLKADDVLLVLGKPTAIRRLTSLV